MQGRKLGFPGILAPSLSLTSVHPQYVLHPKLSIWGRTTIVVVLDPEASYYKYIASAEYVQ